jgi:hypothetical protein
MRVGEDWCVSFQGAVRWDRNFTGFVLVGWKPFTWAFGAGCSYDAPAALKDRQLLRRWKWQDGCGEE